MPTRDTVVYSRLDIFCSFVNKEETILKTVFSFLQYVSFICEKKGKYFKIARKIIPSSFPLKPPSSLF